MNYSERRFKDSNAAHLADHKLAIQWHEQSRLNYHGMHLMHNGEVLDLYDRTSVSTRVIISG